MDRIRRTLEEVEKGHPGATERLYELLYAEVRRMAQHEMAQERPDHTLQATALAHEALLRLNGNGGEGFGSRGEFLAAAAVAIRRVLVEHARQRGRLKRGGDRGRVDLDAVDPAGGLPDETLLELDRALERLQEFSPQHARTVELRFFAGMTIAEIAGHRGVSQSTIEREWRFARAWLRGELGGPMGAEPSRRLVELFERAVELPQPERAEFVETECAGDPQLRDRLTRLLRDDATDAPVLDRFDGLRQLDLTDPMIGQELGAYRLTARIARGGMGVVYRAVRTDGRFDREVAVKLIRVESASRDTRRRFELERRALARLDHENIARLYDGGETDEGDPYFVMEYVEGRPVDEHCDDRGLDVPARLRLFATICRAVHFAHQNLVVHRDLKPSNVLVDARGVPKLLDFGIARVLESDAAGPEVTRTMTRILTPEYASPEQLAGLHVTTATDVYSLGVVLYRLLTGRRPFRLGTGSPLGWSSRPPDRPPARPSSRVLHARPEDGEDVEGPQRRARQRGTTPARLRRQLAGDLDRIVMMAMRPEPERRYPSAVELAEDLDRHLAGRPVHAREDSLAYRTSRFVMRNRIGVGAGAMILVALALGLVAARRGEQRAREEAQHASVEATSFHRIAQFLTDTFLSRHELLGPELRREAAAHVHRQATSVRVEYASDVHLRANLLDSLGVVCLRMGLFEDAEQLLGEAHELRRDEFGPRSLEVALSLRHIGELRLRRGDFSRAAASLGEAVELNRTCPPGPHTDLAAALNDLAVVLRNLGDDDQAQRLHLEALELRRAAADGSPAVAESLNNLSGILLHRGDHAGARELLDEALAIRRRILGEGALETGQTTANLAQAVWGLGDHERARELLDTAESTFRDLGAQGRTELGRTLCSLATLDLVRRDPGAAREHLGEALSIQTEELGPDHPDVATTLTELAKLEWRFGSPGEARAAFEESLRIRRECLSSESPLLGRTLQEYGNHLMVIGAGDEAEAPLREAVKILGTPPITHPTWLGRAEVILGMWLERRGLRAEALEITRSGARRLEVAADASEADKRMSRDRLRSLESSSH